MNICVIDFLVSNKIFHLSTFISSCSAYFSVPIFPFLQPMRILSGRENTPCGGPTIAYLSVPQFPKFDKVSGFYLFIYLFNSPKIHYTDKKNKNIYKSGARNLLETIGLFN